MLVPHRGLILGKRYWEPVPLYQQFSAYLWVGAEHVNLELLRPKLMSGCVQWIAVAEDMFDGFRSIGSAVYVEGLAVHTYPVPIAPQLFGVPVSSV